MGFVRPRATGDEPHFIGAAAVDDPEDEAFMSTTRGRGDKNGTFRLVGHVNIGCLSRQMSETEGKTCIGTHSRVDLASSDFSDVSTHVSTTGSCLNTPFDGVETLKDGEKMKHKSPCSRTHIISSA